MKDRTDWTVKKAKEVIRKYKDISTLKKECGSLIYWLNKKGLFQTLTKKLTRRGRWGVRSYSKLNKELVMEIAKKCKTKSQFKKKYLRYYTFAKNNGFYQKACSHMPSWVKKKITYSDDFLIKEAQKFSSFKDLRKNNPSLRSVIMKRELQKKAFAHIYKSQLYRKPGKRRSDLELINMCLKFKTIKDLKKNKPKILGLIYKRNLQSQAFSHMKRKKRE